MFGAQSQGQFLCAHLILAAQVMITSLSNDKVKFVRALSVRKNRLREGRFVVEGARLIDDALNAGVKPDWVFCAERLATSTVAVVARLHELGLEVLDVSDAVMQACSETETPQGLLAVVPVPRLAMPRDPGLVLIVDNLRDPGNLGTLLRSAAAAGVDLALLTPGTVDVFNAKVVRSAMGVHFRLPILYEDWQAIGVRLHEMKIYLAATRAEQIYTQVDWTQPSALIIGGEAEGASESAVQLATTRVAIPLARDVESLNAAMAGSVILFEADRQRREKNGARDSGRD